MADEPVAEFEGIEASHEQWADLAEWLADQRGKLFWDIIERDRDDAHARARMPVGRTYKASPDMELLVPLDICAAESQQNLAQEQTLVNVLHLPEIVREWLQNLDNPGEPAAS